MFEARHIRTVEKLVGTPDFDLFAEGLSKEMVVYIPAERVAIYERFWFIFHRKPELCSVPFHVSCVQRAKDATFISGKVILNGIPVSYGFIRDDPSGEIMVIRGW